jgi:hypothetical protein
MVRRIILNVHIYSGLLCFSYLILFGISALNFNHRFAFTKSPASVTTWTQPMALPALDRNDGEAVRVRRENNEAILRALGSFTLSNPNVDGGWTDADTYHARFLRPGKQYDVDVHVSRGTATITQTRASFWTLVRDLHGAYAVYPESLLASSWGWYTNLCVFVVVFGAISGI